MKSVVISFILWTIHCCWLAAVQAEEPRMDGAKWIWCAPKGGADGVNFGKETRYFRGTMTVPEKTAGLTIDITADNLFKLWVNGKLVGTSDSDPNRWSSPLRFDIGKQLKPGRNILAVEATNTAPGPAGLILKVLGDTYSFTSDGEWKARESSEPGWEKAQYDDSGWPRAVVLGDYGMAPWGNFLSPVTRSVAPVTTELTAPADYAWPEGIVFVGEDCSLYSQKARNSFDSLSVTVFSARHSRAFPEHDLPAPVKVGHKLYRLSPARPGSEPVCLMDAGKGALGSPSVSFDGLSIYFSMAFDGDPFYHIYRLPAAGGKPIQLTHGPFHDIDPTEMPDGRIVFVSTRVGRYEEYHQSPSRGLFTMQADGSDISALTHTFIFDNEPEVMADGRIIMLRSDNFFDRGKVETLLYAVQPDGTAGQTLFGLDNGPEYGNRLRSFICGSPAPMPDGRVAFVSGPGITIGRPGSSSAQQQHLRLPAGDVACLPDGQLLCTLPAPATEAVPDLPGYPDAGYRTIAIINPDKPEGVLTVWRAAGRAIHSPVFLGARKRPPVLAGFLNAKQESVGATGYFFCRDARFTKNSTAGWSQVRAVRVLAGTGLTLRSSHSYIVHAGSEVTELGTVPLAPDGSFSIEVPADTAIAFQAVDAEGRSEINEMSWVFTRPGEQRSCLGCHESRQSAPVATTPAMAIRTVPLKLLGEGRPHRFRGNNAAVTGLMELQFDRYREVAGLNRHTADAGMTGKEEIAALIRHLADKDKGSRLSAAQNLAIFRDSSAAAELATLLRADEREVRVAAAVALAACGTRESTTALLAALSDPDPLVAQASAMALENLTGHEVGFNAFASPPQLQAEPEKWRQWLAQTPWDEIERMLIQQLNAGDRDKARRAAVALGHVGGSVAAPALRGFIATASADNPYPAWKKTHRGDGTQFNALAAVNPRAMQAAIRALGMLRDQASVEMLTALIAQNSDEATGSLFIVEAAAEALGRIGTAAAGTALIQAFTKFKAYQSYCRWYGDHDALIACHAAPPHFYVIEALDRMGIKDAVAIVPQLIRSLPTDPDRALFLENDDYESLVGRVIRRNGGEAAVVETCLSLLGESSAACDPEIAKAVGDVHGAWAGKPGPEIRAAQVLSLVCRNPGGEAKVREALDRYREKKTTILRQFDTGIPVVNELPIEHWVCFYLARTLGNIGHSESVPVLLAGLAQPAEAAGGHPDPLGPAVHFLQNDVTPCWRAACAWALGQIGDRRAIPALLDVVKDLNNATDTRHAAVEALGKMAGDGELAALQAVADGYPELSTRDALIGLCAKLKKP